MSRTHLDFCLAIVIAGGLFAGVAQAQFQESTSPQSVAEAAARAKEAKKKASGKTKVLTEEDLAAKAAKAGEQVPPSAAAETGSAPAAGATARAEAAKEKSPGDAKKEDDPEVVELKARLADAEQDLDLTKREAALANDSHYSNPEHARDAAGKAKLDALQQQVNEKQRIVQELKDKLSALGVKPTSATPAPPRS